MRGFVPIGRHYVADLDEVERVILARVVADTADLLGTHLADGAHQDAAPDALTGPDALGGPDALTWPDAHAEEPADPALARLLPSASQDREVAHEFRRLTESDLRRRKVANLRLVWTGLRGPAGPLVVPHEAAPAWAAALTDVRLVLASRLGIETDDDAERLYDVAAGAVDPADEDSPGDDEDSSGDDEDSSEDGWGGTGEDEALDAEVRAALAALYAALTWLSESLVQAMLDDLPGESA